MVIFAESSSLIDDSNNYLLSYFSISLFLNLTDNTLDFSGKIVEDLILV